MGLFNIKKKEKTKETPKENEKGVIEPTSEEQQMLDRLCKHAGNTIAMLKNVLSGPNGCDMYIVTLYAAGLSGIACHEAVKATDKEITVVVTKDGKKYFMGDELNKYLHENKFSVTSMVRAVTGSSEKALISILTRQAQVIGSEEFVVNGNMDPKDLYKNIKSCWDGIFNNMTVKYCQSPEEWPIFFGIVLQNIIAESLQYVSKDAIFNTVVDVACALSKMDIESL